MLAELFVLFTPNRPLPVLPVLLLLALPNKPPLVLPVELLLPPNRLPAPLLVVLGSEEIVEPLVEGGSNSKVGLSVILRIDDGYAKE